MHKDLKKLVVGGQQGSSDKRLMEKTGIYPSQVPDGTERSSLVSHQVRRRAANQPAHGRLHRR